MRAASCSTVQSAAQTICEERPAHTFCSWHAHAHSGPHSGKSAMNGGPRARGRTRLVDHALGLDLVQVLQHVTRVHHRDDGVQRACLLRARARVASPIPMRLPPAAKAGDCHPQTPTHRRSAHSSSIAAPASHHDALTTPCHENAM